MHVCIGPITWFEIMQCVSVEMFQMLSTKISDSLQQKSLEDSNFKMIDTGDKVVDDIMMRLKEKRMMSNKEISYLRQLIDRANAVKMIEYSLVIHHVVFEMYIYLYYDQVVFVHNPSEIYLHFNMFVHVPYRWFRVQSYSN